jgi:hypothetical protein
MCSGWSSWGVVVPGAVKILCMHNIVPTTVVPIELECLLNCVEWVLNSQIGKPIEFSGEGIELRGGIKLRKGY